MDAYKYILDPPEKVKLMYAAVSDLIRKNSNVESLKVSDITAKAGIGKGTAYEYFKSKEELITCALVYEYGGKLKALEEKIFHTVGFKKRYESLLDWIVDNRDYNMLFVKMFQVNLGMPAPEEMHEKLPAELIDGIGEYLRSMIAKLMLEGVEEGVFAEKHEGKLSMALLMSVMQYAFYVGDSFCFMTNEMSDEEVRAFTYEAMVKTLN